MQSIDIPGTEESVNPTNPKDVIMTALVLTAGATFALTALQGGQDASSYVYERVSSALGVGNESDQSDLF